MIIHPLNYFIICDLLLKQIIYSILEKIVQLWFWNCSGCNDWWFIWLIRIALRAFVFAGYSLRACLGDKVDLPLGPWMSWVHLFIINVMLLEFLNLTCSRCTYFELAFSTDPLVTGAPDTIWRLNESARIFFTKVHGEFPHHVPVGLWSRAIVCCSRMSDW